jgi:hypothetical protein
MCGMTMKRVVVAVVLYVLMMCWLPFAQRQVWDQLPPSLTSQLAFECSYMLTVCFVAFVPPFAIWFWMLIGLGQEP